MVTVGNTCYRYAVPRTKMLDFASIMKACYYAWGFPWRLVLLVLELARGCGMHHVVCTCARRSTRTGEHASRQ